MEKRKNILFATYIVLASIAAFCISILNKEEANQFASNMDSSWFQNDNMANSVVWLSDIIMSVLDLVRYLF